MNEAPVKVTIVIPVYNEEGILRSSVIELIDAMQRFPFDYRIVLAENGSTDRTVDLAEELARRFPQVSHFSTGEPGNGNYGKALQRGILRADSEYVICDEIDLCDTDFYARALEVLDRREASLVVGSKLLEGANDQRPMLRHAGSVVINGMLRVALGFRGTDTHGLKAFRRETLAPIAERCVVDKDLFASEFVIRAEREGIAIKEIPIRIVEKREPSVHLFRRVPNVLADLAKLVVAIRFQK